MVSKAIASNKRPFVMKKDSSVLADFADGGAVAGYPGDYYGRIYYVNMFTGDSSYDGLSWDTPFEQVNDAITASETYRAAVSGADNDYQRNIIYIQAITGGYDPLTALPSYCDMIGIGSNVRGGSGGTVSIWSETGDAAVGSAKGLYMTNLQFSSSVAGSYAMDAVTILRSTIENCAFMIHDGGSGALGGAWRSVGHFAGNTVKDCVFGLSNAPYACANGFEHSGGVGNNNWFENNVFLGTAYPVKIAQDLNDNGTVWKNNFMHSIYGPTEPTSGSQFGANCILIGNYMVGGSTAVIGVADSQMIANITQDGGVTAVESSTS